jgi:precorrin-6A synthase
MKRVLVIGVGAGDPDQITLQAVDALNRADVFFVFDKGSQKEDLVRIRKQICERFVKNRSYRLLAVPSPPRDASMPSYKAGVSAWHEERAEVVKSLIRDEIADGGCGAFLVWGDPSLYDSTLRILHQVAADSSIQFDYDVIPGISSIQALAARHRIALNAIGEPVLITTGRKLAEGFPDDADSVVVLLDAGSGLESIAREDAEIFWGAYLGTEDEILISGRVCDVIDQIMRSRRERKAEKGWIMDTYLLRRGN